jgi:predicted anti-sigma-YlaC factor YlaD
MHGSIRDRLEDLLAAKPSAVGQQSLTDHLSGCAECSEELESMRKQAALLSTLRAPEDIGPAPGFYARVMQRIEERTKESIWAVFIYSPFGKRLAFASLAIALILGTYVVTEETRDGHLGTERLIAQQIHDDPPVVIGSAAQQRDAVLENFASSQRSLQ